MQTGKKACRIASENGLLFQMIQLGALQDPLFRVYSQVSAQVRKIRTKQNLINPRYIAQHAKHGIACRKGCVRWLDRSLQRHPPRNRQCPSDLRSAGRPAGVALRTRRVEEARIRGCEGPADVMLRLCSAKTASFDCICLWRLVLFGRREHYTRRGEPLCSPGFAK